MRPMHAEEDARLRARVVRRAALHHRDGADAALDRPGHVRAASGLCWWRGRLAVVSDDASFAGLIDAATGQTEAITLPHAPGERRQFDKGRGNKADKLDLECVIAAGDRLIAFGSDSGLAVRRAAVVIDVDHASGDGVRVVPLPRLYAALRQPVLGTGVVNLEAATVRGDTLVLGNRGGDVGDDGVPTADAIAELPLSALLALLDDPARAPVPAITWRVIELGRLGDAPLRLTELEARGDELLYAATAEATTTAYDDGAVAGSAIGVIAGGAARWTRIVDEENAPLLAKIEGLVALPTRDRVLATVDADDPARPSELLELTLEA